MYRWLKWLDEGPVDTVSRRQFLTIGMLAASAWPLRRRLGGVRHSVPIFSVRDFGARANGVTDDTIAIQRAIDAAVAAAPAIVAFPSTDGWYRLGSTLTLKGARHVVLLGDGPVRPMIAQTASNAIVLRLDDCSDCEVRELHVRGLGRADPLLDRPTTYAPALLVARSRRILVEHCLVERGVSNGIDGFNSTDCVVRDNECRDTALYNGIGWAGGAGNRFVGNVLHGNRGQGIECRSLTGFVVEKNHCFGNGDPDFNQSSGITVEAENGVIAVVDASNTTPIRLRMDRPHLRQTGDRLTVRDVRGNTAANGTFQVTVVDAYQVLLAGSRGNGSSAGGTAVVPVDQMLAPVSTQGLIVDNTCEDNNGYGIYVVASNNARVTRITLRHNNVRRNTLDGIACVTGVETQQYRDCREIHIDNCDVEANRRGILAYFCADVSITGNHIRHNHGSGIECQASTIAEYAANCLSNNRPEVAGLPARLAGPAC